MRRSRSLLVAFSIGLSAGCADKSAPEAPAPKAPAGAAGPASKPASHPASKPASHPASKPASKPAGPRAAAQGLGPNGEIRPQASDRCAVCAMRPHAHPKFASALELADGRTFYTCGTGCFLRAHLHPEVYLGAKDVARRRVPDYFSGESIDADAAYWVAGSDVNGPMGPAPVAVTSEKAVETFQRRHGGKHTFQLKDLDDARFEAITGKRAVKR